MHRLFVAIPVFPLLVDSLAPAMEGGPPRLRWVPEDDLHCTLRFIGTVERPMVPTIMEALDTIQAPSMQAHIDGIGVFDHRHHGALWARLQPKAELAYLHHKLDRSMVSLGLAPERRAYLPHITLARWSGGRIDARGWAQRHAGLSSDAALIDRFCLYESQLARTGPAYEQIASYSLGAMS